jgi:hypothetical protein
MNNSSKYEVVELADAKADTGRWAQRDTAMGADPLTFPSKQHFDLVQYLI